MRMVEPRPVLLATDEEELAATARRITGFCNSGWIDVPTHARVMAAIESDRARLRAAHGMAPGGIKTPPPPAQGGAAASIGGRTD